MGASQDIHKAGGTSDESNIHVKDLTLCHSGRINGRGAARCLPKFSHTVSTARHYMRTRTVVKFGDVIHVLLGKAETLLSTMCKMLMPNFEVEDVFFHSAKDIIG